jgi:hypothetical protein
VSLQEENEKVARNVTRFLMPVRLIILHSRSNVPILRTRAV